MSAIVVLGWAAWARAADVAPARVIGEAPGTLPGKVLSVDWSPDGRHFAAGGFFGEVRVWDAATGAVRHRLRIEGRDPAAVRVVFSPDGARLAMGGSEHRLTVWDVASGRALLDRADDPGSTSQLHGVTLLAGGDVGVATSGGWAWLDANGAKSAEYERAPGGRYTYSQLEEHGPYVAALGAGLDLFEKATGRRVAHADGDAMDLAGMAFVPEGIALGQGEPAKLRILSVPALTDVRTVDLGARSLGNLRAGADGRVVAATSEGVRLWDAKRGVVKLDDAFARDAVASPDGRTVLVARGTAVQRIDVATGRPAASAGHVGRVRGLAFAGADVVVSAGDDGTVRAWSVADGAQRWKTSLPAPAVGPALGDRGLVVGAGDGAVRVLDPATGAEKARAASHGAPVVAVAARGPHVVSVAADGSLSTGGRVGDDARGVESIAVAPDGRLAVGVFSPTMRSVQRFDAAGRPEGAPDDVGNHAHALAWDAAGRELAAAAMYPTVFGAAVRRFEDVPDVLAVAFSPDGGSLALGGEDGRVEIRSRDGKLRHRLTGASGHVRAVAWSPDGQRVAAAGDDGAIRVWITP
jgi:WD40 repeat protein